jgi:hypothetical protein
MRTPDAKKPVTYGMYWRAKKMREKGKATPLDLRRIEEYEKKRDSHAETQSASAPEKAPPQAEGLPDIGEHKAPEPPPVDGVSEEKKPEETPPETEKKEAPKSPPKTPQPDMSPEAKKEAADRLASFATGFVIAANKYNIECEGIGLADFMIQEFHNSLSRVIQRSPIVVNAEEYDNAIVLGTGGFTCGQALYHRFFSKKKDEKDAKATPKNGTPVHSPSVAQTVPRKPAEDGAKPATVAEVVSMQKWNGERDKDPVC